MEDSWVVRTIRTEKLNILLASMYSMSWEIVFMISMVCFGGLIMSVMKLRIFVVLPLVAATSGLSAQTPPLAPHQQLTRDIYKQLIEINTTDSVGNTTVAAEAMAARFRAAGFPAADIF